MFLLEKSNWALVIGLSAGWRELDHGTHGWQSQTGGFALVMGLRVGLKGREANGLFEYLTRVHSSTMFDDTYCEWPQSGMSQPMSDTQEHVTQDRSTLHRSDAQLPD